jgi:hypothetical protein
MLPLILHDHMGHVEHRSNESGQIALGHQQRDIVHAPVGERG